MVALLRARLFVQPELLFFAAEEQPPVGQGLLGLTSRPIKRLEAMPGTLVRSMASTMACAHAALLELAGIEFIDENGGGTGCCDFAIVSGKKILNSRR